MLKTLFLLKPQIIDRVPTPPTPVRPEGGGGADLGEARGGGGGGCFLKRGGGYKRGWVNVDCEGLMIGRRLMLI
jgi:hypothetical protein